MNLSNALCLFAATALSTVAAPAAWERLAPLPVPNGGFIGAAISNTTMVPQAGAESRCRQAPSLCARLAMPLRP